MQNENESKLGVTKADGTPGKKLNWKDKQKRCRKCQTITFASACPKCPEKGTTDIECPICNEWHPYTTIMQHLRGKHGNIVPAPIARKKRKKSSEDQTSPEPPTKKKRTAKPEAATSSTVATASATSFTPSPTVKNSTTLYVKILLSKSPSSSTTSTSSSTSTIPSSSSLIKLIAVPYTASLKEFLQAVAMNTMFNIEFQTSSTKVQAFCGRASGIMKIKQIEYIDEDLAYQEQTDEADEEQWMQITDEPEWELATGMVHELSLSKLRVRMLL